MKNPIKVLQFGTGNFLRAFADYFFDKLNSEGHFNGKIAMVKTTESGGVNEFKLQKNKYNVVFEGIIDGKPCSEVRKIEAVEEVFDIREDYGSYIELAESRDLRIIVSNTTEAGIVFNAEDKFEEKFNVSFPAKLTQFLYMRFVEFGNDNTAGLYVLPCELIDNNAGELKICILKYIELWGLSDGFKRWINEANYFCNTLVDRIVTGNPKSNESGYFERIGGIDRLLCIAEPYAFWAIERKGEIEKLMDCESIKEIIFVNDIRPYKVRKVRLLNGSHSAVAPIGLMLDIATVGEAVADADIKKYLEKAVDFEIKPAIPLPSDEVDAFAADVFARFKNPYLKHQLSSIALNSVSKWRARILPTVLDGIGKGRDCTLLIASLGFLFALYKSGKFEIHDEQSVKDFFAKEPTIGAFLKTIDFWGQDLTLLKQFFTAIVTADSLEGCDAREVLKELL
jgi:tagaturonate reductase